MSILQLKPLRALFLLSALIGITPPYSYKTRSFILSRFYKFYRILVLLYWIVGSIYGFQDQYWYLFKLLPGTLQTVNLLSSFSLSLQIAVVLLSSNISNSKNLSVLLKDLIILEWRFNKKDNPNNRIWFELIVVHIFFLTSASLDFHLWFSASGNEVHFYQFHQNLQKYHTLITVELICNLILRIKDRFTLANKALGTAIKDISTVTERSKASKDVIKSFLILNADIEIFNKVYGWVMLCLNTTILTNLLVSLNFMIQYGKKARSLTEKYGAEFIALMTLWALGSLAIGISLANVANQTVKEARNTPNLCYKLLSLIPVQSPNIQDEELREDLLLLSEQMALREPRFSAAGFFDVDYMMLFTMLSSITSYVVVLIQIG